MAYRRKARQCYTSCQICPLLISSTKHHFCTPHTKYNHNHTFYLQILMSVRSHWPFSFKPWWILVSFLSLSLSLQQSQQHLFIILQKKLHHLHCHHLYSSHNFLNMLRHLGVYNTTMYELDLRAQSIGPHILAETDDKMLSRIGIAIGNIICLKKGSTVWWNGLDAKWKCSKTGQSNVDQPQHKEKSPVCPPPKKKVAYEKKYHDGSGSCFMGPLMQADGGDDNPSKDYNLWYQSVEHGIWLPVPKGYMYWL